MNAKKFQAVITRAKKEILADIKEKTIPTTIKSFKDLHFYVDANYYGGFCDEDYIISKDFELENRVQNLLDNWIKSKKFKDKMLTIFC